MNNKNIVTLISGVFLGVVLVMCVGSNSNDLKENVTKNNQLTENHESLDSALSTYKNLIIENYKIYSLPITGVYDFAEENVPIENLLVKEALDREFLVNTYWHSNTFLNMKRASRWFPIIESILQKNGIPDDFKFLAVIESGLNNVTSPSGAKGFWQFMPATASQYNLEVSESVDERLHVEKATEAACAYLLKAYKKFNNWTLAAASYNMGKAGLQKQLDIQMANNYYDLLLNAETARYVYRIIAVKYIFDHPEAFGFNIREQDMYKPYSITEVMVDSAITNIAVFAKNQGTNYKTVKTLNPWIKGNSLHSKEDKVYTLKFPEPNTGLNVIESQNE